MEDVAIRDVVGDRLHGREHEVVRNADQKRDQVERALARRDDGDDRDRHSRQHGAVEEEQQSVDGERTPVRQRGAKARRERPPGAAILEHDQRGANHTASSVGSAQTMPKSIAASTRGLATIASSGLPPR
jgi:hypothetical protein